MGSPAGRTSGRDLPGHRPRAGSGERPRLGRADRGPSQPAQPSAKLIAPLWHTALFLLAISGLAAWGAHRHGLPAFGSSRATGYLFTIAWEWLLFALASWRMRLGGISIKSVIGGRWTRPTDFFRDLGIGIGFLIGSNILLAGLQAILRPGPKRKHWQIASPEPNRDHALDIFVAFGRNLRRVHFPRIICKSS